MWEAHDALIVEFRDQVGYGVDGEAWINEDADKLGLAQRTGNDPEYRLSYRAGLRCFYKPDEELSRDEVWDIVAECYQEPVTRAAGIFMLRAIALNIEQWGPDYPGLEPEDPRLEMLETQPRIFFPGEPEHSFLTFRLNCPIAYV